MDKKPLHLNPYDVLGVSQAASNTEIKHAYNKAFKEKRHPIAILTDAQKALHDRNRRLAADFLRPILPPVRRFKRGDYAALAADPAELAFIAEFDGLDEAMARALEEEALETAELQELTRHIPVPNASAVPVEGEAHV